MKTPAHSPIFSNYAFSLCKMALTWLAALVVAGGHHVFNASLNGKKPADGILTPESQAGASFLGTMFAFLVSAFLGMSGGTAFIQSARRIVQRRSFTLTGLDALWSSPHNVLAFLSFDFWKSAREVVIVAALAWAFPFIVTFAPGTLSVQNDIKPSSAACMVPTFDFGSSALYDQLDSASKPFLQPSALASRVVGATLLGGKPLSPTSPCTGNCSYLTSVNAPSFSCTSGFPNASDLTWGSGAERDPPPWVGGNFDAAVPAYDAYSGWDFVGHYADSGNFIPLSGGTNFTCIAYNSTYHLNYTFTQSIPTVSVEQIVLNQPATQLMLGNNSQRDSSIDNPDFVNGSDTQPHSAWFNTTTNYYAVLSSLYTFVVGNITMYESGDSENFVYSPSNLAVTQTALATSAENGNITWGDPVTAMESLLSNITLSMLTVDPSQTTGTTCVHSDSLPYFSYNARRLWLVYGLALGLALLCDLIGVLALLHNRFSAMAGFTDFLAATRNPELDDVDFSEGSQRDRLRLRYGPLGDGSGRQAFAFPDSLQTAEDCKGLRVSGRGEENHELAPLTFKKGPRV
ncbi:hypothetical protein DFH07DRAFT_1054420 [Mycena maculata]|uniref:Uncharacterized protein n=1 Tax=Mycena maculata TaxID=230809 RepID=A0AAD7P2B6_9AGAR|nr:hypothetical protein DFH07DRAFT_1054420 [Mycena maculata]